MSIELVNEKKRKRSKKGSKKGSKRVEVQVQQKVMRKKSKKSSKESSKKSSSNVFTKPSLVAVNSAQNRPSIHRRTRCFSAFIFNTAR